MKSQSLAVSSLTDMPVEVRSFLKKALIIFICWKLLYHIFLAPQRILDKPLTDITAQTTGVLYRNLLKEPAVSVKQDFHDPNFPKAAIYIGSRRSIGIADPCNGLELYILYISFLFCIPVGYKRQLAFTAGGIAGIFVLNGFRCLGLAWLNFHNYAIADFAHHYLFKMIIYAAIFFAWVAFSKKYFSNAF